jgi:hypothetical protein
MVKSRYSIAELEKKLEEEQAGKRTPLTNNIMIVLMVVLV